MPKRLFAIAVVFFLFIGCTERRQNQLLEQGEERSLQGRYQEAAELFRKAIALNPEGRAGIKALYKLGYTNETYLKEYDAAISSFNEFVRLSTDPVTTYEVQKRIANIYFEQNKDSEKTIVAYKKLLQLSPDSLERDLFQFRIAQSYFRINDFEQARLEFNQLLEDFPKSQFAPRTRFEIGNTYYMEGKYEIAVGALKAVVRHHPGTDFATEAEFLIAQCLEQQGNLKEAMSAYQALETKYPSPTIISFRIDAIKKRIKKEK